MPKRLRVLMMIDQFNLGGTETYTLSISRKLKQQAIPVFVAGSPDRLQIQFRKAGIPIFTHPKATNFFMKWIRKSKITLINAHTNASMIPAAKISKKLNIPLVVTVHGTYYSNKKLALIRRIHPHRTSFISVSPHVQRWLKAKHILSTFIPNGIDLNEFQPLSSKQKRMKLNIPEGSPVLLYVSRLQGKKGKLCEAVIYAFHNYVLPQFSNAHLLIVGKGDRIHLIRKLTRRHNNIHLLGPRTDLPHLYSLSTCVIGSGRVALEAMACSRPVIAVGEAGFIGLITVSNIHNAWKSNFGDHQANGRYTHHLIGADMNKVLRSPSKWKQWGAKGNQVVHKMFRINRIVKQLIRFYRSRL